MPRDAVTGVNAGSGDGLRTPREASATSVLHVRQLTTYTPRSVEERAVVNAGSKECSRCEPEARHASADGPPVTVARCLNPGPGCDEAIEHVLPLPASVARDLQSTVGEGHLDTELAAIAGLSSRLSPPATDTPPCTVPVLPDSRADSGARTAVHVQHARLASTTAHPVARRRAYSLGSAQRSHMPPRAGAMYQSGHHRPTSGGSALGRRVPHTDGGGVAPRPASSSAARTSDARRPDTESAPKTDSDITGVLATAADPCEHDASRRSAPPAEKERVWYALSDEAFADRGRALTASGLECESPRAPSSTGAAAASHQGVWIDAAEVPDMLVCEVCLQLAELPHTTDCGHLFCRNCLDRWLCDHKQCPVDRQPLRASEVRYDRRAERQIAALPCHCAGSQTTLPVDGTNHAAERRGQRACIDGAAQTTGPAAATAASCTWTGCISDAVEHMRRCPHVPIRCPFAAHGCKVVVPRAEMTDHVATAATTHNTLLIQALAALQERHRELTEEVDVLRLRTPPSTVVASPSSVALAAASTGFMPLAPLGTATRRIYPEPVHSRRRRHSSPTLTSLVMPTLPVVARYIWAVMDFSQLLGLAQCPRRPSHLLLSSPAPALTALGRAGDVTASPRLAYSPAFCSAPLPAAAEMREYLDSSFSFSSLSSAAVGAGAAEGGVTRQAIGTSLASVNSQPLGPTAAEDYRGSHRLAEAVPLPPPPVTEPRSANAPLQWYLGLASHPMPHADSGEAGTRCDIYLFGHRHPYRTVFRLTIYHGTDPSLDIVHLVDDWQPAFKGKGWGPTNFIDPCRLEAEGYTVRDCLRVGVEILGHPF